MRVATRTTYPPDTTLHIVSNTPASPKGAENISRVATRTTYPPAHRADTTPRAISSAPASCPGCRTHNEGKHRPCTWAANRPTRNLEHPNLVKKAVKT